MKGINKHTLKNGINFYYIPVEKFKTFSLSINIHRQLNKQDATKNALIPYVLRRGCMSYPTSQVLSKQLETLYGTVFDCGINKKGEDQIIYFNFEAVEDKYIPEKVNIIKDVLKLSKEIVFNPVVEKSLFKVEYVSQEKSKLKELIQSVINNKMTYAVERCYEEMCKDQNFGIYELGDIEDVDGIDEKVLYEHYIDIIKNSPIDIYIAGDFNEETIKSLVSEVFDIYVNNNVSYPSNEIFAGNGDVKKTEEVLQVSQGKLSLGFETNVNIKSDEYYAFLVFNGVFGGGPYSKLFNNVRERLGLAYYVFSRFEKFKSIMMVSSGIETGNFQKAYDEILFQLGEIKKGNISDNEFQSSVNSILNSIKSLKDSSFNMIDYYLGQILSGTNDSIDDFINKISKVGIEDVIKVAQKVKLDTVYFLKGS